MTAGLAQAEHAPAATKQRGDRESECRAALRAEAVSHRAASVGKQRLAEG